jgi:quercetin dioxygenase-like cupin family protein
MQLRNRERDATPFVTKDGSTIREFFHSEQQSLAEASLEPERATERHYHARSEEIYLVLEGEGELEVDGDRRLVTSGDAILIPPGAWHELTAGEHGIRFLCCCVPPYSDDDTFFRDDRGHEIAISGA